MKKKWIAMLLVAALSVGSVTYSNATETTSGSELMINESEAMSTDSEIVNIPDAILKAEIVAEVDANADGEVSRGEMLNLTQVHISDESGYGTLIDLTGLEYAKYLNELQIYYYGVKSFEPIAMLEELSCITVNNSSMKEIVELKNIKNLENLDLSNNQIEGVSSFEGMGNLRIVNFSNNQITEIESFEGINTLLTLDFSNNLLTQIPTLENMETSGGSAGDMWIDFSNNQLQSIPSLKGPHYIARLNLSNNLIRNVSVTEDCFDTLWSNLDELDLSNNSIESIAAFQEWSDGWDIFLPEESLNLEGNPLSDISSLEFVLETTERVLLSSSENVNWEILFQNISEIADVEVVLGHPITIDGIVPGMSSICLDGNVIDTEQFTISIENTQIADIEENMLHGKSTGVTEGIVTIGNARKTFNIYVDETIEIPDGHLKAALEYYDENGDGIYTRGELEDITSLSIDNDNCENDNCLVDLSGLEYAVDLESIYFDGCRPKQIEDLMRYEKLTRLSLNNTNLIDVDGIIALKNLQDLDLSGNQIRKIPDLSDLNELCWINCSNNQIEKISDLPKTLGRVDFSNNKLSDLSSFVNLENIWYADFSNNPITDIQALKVIMKNNSLSLELYLSSNQIVTWENIFEFLVQEKNHEKMTVIEGNSMEITQGSLGRLISGTWISLDYEGLPIEELKFEIADTSVAQVEDAVLIGKGNGITTLQVTFREKSYSVDVQVIERENPVDSDIEEIIGLDVHSDNVYTYLDEKQNLWNISPGKVDRVSPNIISYIGKIVYGENSTMWGKYYAVDKDGILWEYNKDSYEEDYRHVKIYENTKSVHRPTKDVVYAVTEEKKLINVYTGEVCCENVDDIYIQPSDPEIHILSGNQMKYALVNDGEFEIIGTVDNVKKLLKEYVIKTDGSVWGFWNLDDEINEYKIADEEPLDIVHYYDEYILDKNHVLWRCDYGGNKEEVMKDVAFTTVEIIVKTDGTTWKYNERTGGYEMTDGIVEEQYGYYLKNDGTLWERTEYMTDNYIIGDVVSYSVNPSADVLCLVRKDGSVWRYGHKDLERVPEMIKEAESVKGDVSDDMDVSIKDVQMIFSYISGKINFTTTQLTVADVNDDGQVTANDMQRIFYYVNGKVEGL